MDGHEHSLASILTCRFMISLRQFDSTIANATHSELGSSRVRELVASTVLQFGAQPSDSLPAAISSFAHPIHIDESLFDVDPDATFEDGYELQDARTLDVVAPVHETPSSQSPPDRDQTLASEASKSV